MSIVEKEIALTIEQWVGVMGVGVLECLLAQSVLRSPE